MIDSWVLCKWWFYKTQEQDGIWNLDLNPTKCSTKDVPKQVSKKCL